MWAKAFIDRHKLAAICAWMLVSALYVWLASGVASGNADRRDVWHHYDYLVDGFLSGHLYLSVSPPKELLALSDPYDPRQNLRYRLHDASLYKGKYYLYFGPTPALLLMLPWKALTGHHLPLWLAASVFATVGFGALTLMLAGIRARHFPLISPFQLFCVVLIAGQVTWLPVIMQHPAFWELPIVAAVALFWCSLLFLWKYHDTGGRVRFGVAAGVALAFLLGARPNHLFAAGILALFFAPPFVSVRPVSTWTRRILPVGIPLALGIGGLLAYNFLRFDRFFEFGQHYQLWADDWRGHSFFSYRYLPYNLQFYLLSLPEMSPFFPFLHPANLSHFPPGYTFTEDIYGLCFSVPIHLLGLAALVHLYRRRRDLTFRPLQWLLFASAATAIAIIGLLCCFAGANIRYIPEFLAGCSVLTPVGCMVVLADKETFRLPGLFRPLAAGIAVWSVLCVWLVSCEFGGFAQLGHPRFYETVAEIFNYPSYWFARWTGRGFGPVALEVRLPAKPAIGTEILLAAQNGQNVSTLLIDRPAPDRCRLILSVDNVIVVATPVFMCPAQTLHVECEAPWLYPPSVHPYWRSACRDLPQRQRRQTLYAITVQGTRYSQQWRTFDTIHLDPVVHTADFDPRGCAWVEQLRHIAPALAAENEE